MITRHDVLADAVDKCIRELYSYAQPSVNYFEFIEENKKYLKKEAEYYSLPKENRPNYRDYMGPRPYEFYYLPENIFRDIADSYISAYQFDEKQDFLNNIETLKNYCIDPIVDKWIEGELREDGTRWPGHRGYEHPDNLLKELESIVDDPGLAEKIQNKFFEFLDMAGNFFDWNRYLNGFNTNVYLGGTPTSNKESVIENWKKYKNIDIEIDDDKINRDYFGEDE